MRLSQNLTPPSYLLPNPRVGRCFVTTTALGCENYALRFNLFNLTVNDMIQLLTVIIVQDL